MAAFTIYKSTDTSAPQLTGGVGSLLSVLTACLVNGYGSKSAAGWTLPYSGLNVSAYRPGGGNQFYLRVDDTAPGAGGGKEARLGGFESMASITTGTNAFPTAAQGVGGNPVVIARKSNSADTVPRNWVVAADDRTVYGFILTGDTAGSYYAFGFGDFWSTLAGDSYRTLIIGRAAENNNNGNQEGMDGFSAVTSTTIAHYVTRTYTGLGGSVAIGKHGDGYKGSTSNLLGVLQYPNPENNASYISPIWIHEPTAPFVRGKMRGFYHFLHAIASVNDGDTFGGVGPPYVGRSFLILKQGVNATVYVIETSNTLDTN